MFIIAIFQTHIYSGTFYRCYTAHLKSLSQSQIHALIKTKSDCLNYGGEWIKPDLNFDAIGRSFATLSSIASTEGWVRVLWDVVDSKGVDEVPERDYRRYVGSILIIVILFVISLLFLNLFIGVVIETFNR